MNTESIVTLNQPATEMILAAMDLTLQSIPLSLSTSSLKKPQICISYTGEFTLNHT